MRAVLLFLFALVLPTVAVAQEWNAFTPCSVEPPDHVYRDVCSPDYLRRAERAFGVRPFERVTGDNRAVRVVIIEGREYTNGVGQFTLMIDAIERPDGDVHLVVHAVPIDTRELRRRVQLSPSRWGEVSTLAATLEHAPGVGPWRDDIWLHAAEIIVQTRGFGPPRTLYTTLAEGGPAQQMAALVVAKASEELPHCEAQNSPWTLRDCLRGQFSGVRR